MKRIFTLLTLSAVLMLINRSNSQAQCSGPVSRTAPLVGLQYNSTTRVLSVAFGIINNSGATSNVQICAFTPAFRYDTSIMQLDHENKIGNHSYVQAFGGFAANNSATPITVGSYTYDKAVYATYNNSSWVDVIDQKSSNACADLETVNNTTGSKTFFRYWFKMSDRGHQMIMDNLMKVDPGSSCDPKFILRVVNSTSYTVAAADTQSLRLVVFALGNNSTYQGVKIEELDASGSNCTGTVGSTQNIPTGNTSLDVSGIIVPVKYGSFNVTKRGSKSAYINWTTESESNNLGFTIERRTKAGFEPIANIASKGVNGNSAYTLSYDFTDANVNTSGVAYYRIKQTELSGKVEYTDIKAIRFDGSFSISLYPNPTKGIANISIPENQGGVDLYLTDNMGRIINRWVNVTERNKQIKIDNPGYYFLKVVSKASGEQYTEKIIVN